MTAAFIGQSSRLSGVCEALVVSLAAKGKPFERRRRSRQPRRAGMRLAHPDASEGTTMTPKIRLPRKPAKLIGKDRHLPPMMQGDRPIQPIVPPVFRTAGR